MSDYTYNVNFYSDLLEKFGIDSRSLNWGTKESQNLRFEILSKIDSLDNRTILDVGCGLGDYYNWLMQGQVDCQYSGVDITPKMISLAKKRFPEVEFKVSDILNDPTITYKSFDFVMASGIFYLLQNQPFEAMKELISKMYEICRFGLAFNSLSTWADQKEDNEFYADPLETLTFCKSLTKQVVLRHDYHGADFTIYMYRR